MSKNTLTEYKNVYFADSARKGDGSGYYRYSIQTNGLKLYSSSITVFKTAKDAAIALDKKLIENNLEPINILKKVA